ncbi:hypothetical protein DIPPA_16751 [Diplonema papillatum]|nr:hypothetical protein DIPPA_16751 [Diplonema papillatum]
MTLLEFQPVQSTLGHAPPSLFREPSSLEGESRERKLREERFGRWVCASLSDASRSSDRLSNSDPYYHHDPFVPNVGAESWALAHVAMFSCYWANCIVIAFWQFFVWVVNAGADFNEGVCRSLRRYYAASSIATILVAPLVVYVVRRIFRELQQKRFDRLSALFPNPESDTAAPVTEILLAWDLPDILLVCIVVVLTLFEFSSWMVGISFCFHAPGDCGGFTYHGRYMTLFSIMLVAVSSIVIPLVTTLRIQDTPKRYKMNCARRGSAAPASLAGTVPVEYGNLSPQGRARMMSNASSVPPQSPRAAMASLKALDNMSFARNGAPQARDFPTSPALQDELRAAPASLAGTVPVEYGNLSPQGRARMMSNASVPPQSPRAAMASLKALDNMSFARNGAPQARDFPTSPVLLPA